MVIKNQILMTFSHYRQWVGSSGISDHSPIYLEITALSIKPRAPFKFNSVWLHDLSFIEMVKAHWAHNPPSQHLSKAAAFYHKLLLLKNLTIKWAKDKNPKDNQTLSVVEVDLDQKETWRPKSWAIWLKAGDDNSKYLKDFAKGRKATNTIWQLPTPKGCTTHTFHQLSQLGIAHFKQLFKAPTGSNLAEIIRVVGHFPRFVEHEAADELIVHATIGELEQTLKWFQKDKSLGLDGWPIEFYLAFFDILGNDLLSFVEECRLTSKMYEAINTTFIALIQKSDSPNSFDDFQPTSLCNTLYKVIAKIIANQLRPILSHHISLEQFSFLHKR
eukprot:PITA_04125